MFLLIIIRHHNIKSTKGDIKLTMKKILATLVALGLVFQTCAFASVADMAVSYDRATNKISADATVGAEANTPVVVTVAEDNGEALSISNLPEFMYLYKTAAEGVLDLHITMSSDVKSGKYVVSMTAQSGSDSKKVMIVNVNDDSTGGTIDVLAEINGAADADALELIIKANTKMDKLGVDPDLMTARAAYAAYAADILVAEKDGDWTVDTFIAAYNRALALSAIKAGQYVDTAMKSYAKEFGITYDDFEDLTDNEESYVISCLKNVDYTTADLVAVYANIFALKDYKACNTWGELREVILAKREADEAPFNFFAYDEIDPSNHEGMFTTLLAQVMTCEKMEDIIDAFEVVTYAVYEDQINEDEEEGGSSIVEGDSDWGGNTPGTIPLPPKGNSGTTIPAGKDEDVTVSTGTSTPAPYDDKTEAATPAPTETPVETEAPALEAGVFVDTADHWAKDYVKTLADKGVIGGYDDGTFLPNKNVTRAEYIKMVVGMFGLEESAENAFDDVADTAWYKEYVEKAVAAGLVEGDGGKFNPDATITRQDAAVILYRLGITAGDTEISFADEASVADYAKEAVDTLASAGIINGSDGNFNPANAITRAETAAILCRAADKVVAEEPTEAPEEVVEDTTEEVVEDTTEEAVEDTTGEVVEDTTEEVAEDTTEETEAVVEEETEETADEATETE